MNKLKKLTIEALFSLAFLLVTIYMIENHRYSMAYVTAMCSLVHLLNIYDKKNQK